MARSMVPIRVLMEARSTAERQRVGLPVRVSRSLRCLGRAIFASRPGFCMQDPGFLCSEADFYVQDRRFLVGTRDPACGSRWPGSGSPPSHCRIGWRARGSEILQGRIGLRDQERLLRHAGSPRRVLDSRLGCAGSGVRAEFELFTTA